MNPKRLPKSKLQENGLKAVNREEASFHFIKKYLL